MTVASMDNIKDILHAKIAGRKSFGALWCE